MITARIKREKLNKVSTTTIKTAMATATIIKSIIVLPIKLPIIKKCANSQCWEKCG